MKHKIINHKLEQVGKQENGFTLIEILVAVMIFIMITAIAVVSYQSANQRARDGRRQADLQQVRTALEIYRADIGTYPSVNWSDMETALQGPPSYLTTIPTDPKGYGYYYISNGTIYRLCAYMEKGGSGCTSSPACGTKTCNYEVVSP
jgi:general secretion pathway protein G